MSQPDYTELIRRARAARRNSHSPYSGFRVGAALLDTRGSIYTGCNVEISTFALTLCAERTAAFKARSEGVRKFRAIAIASDAEELTPPCGACRQVLWDLCGDIDIILAGPRGPATTMRLSDLLPLAFGPANLARHKKS
jgi:cytidine deaminase